ncbi:MAG: hypothetical protein IT200_02440 [Thermoleophilia bacterium]|nr:hypothetical protein [Thermoleophilia bacterium]
MASRTRLLALVAASLACAAPASAAPTLIRTEAPPGEIAVGAGGMWVVQEGTPRTLRLYDLTTGTPVGEPVILHDDASLQRYWGKPLVPCCAVPHPLVVSAGSAWTVTAGGRIVRATRTGNTITVTSIGLEGSARDVAAGSSGLYALEVRVPGGVPWAGHRVDTIDTATDAVAVGRIFDPPVTGGTIFEGQGPLQLAAGNPGIFWGTKASVSMRTYRLDRLAASRGAGVPVVSGGRLIARARGVTWLKQQYACAITRLSPAGRATSVPERWDATSRGGCRLRRITADGHGALWAIGQVRGHTRARVFRLDGTTGRLTAAPVRVGFDPWSLAPAGRGVWVGDFTARTIRFVPARG